MPAETRRRSHGTSRVRFHPAVPPCKSPCGRNDGTTSGRHSHPVIPTFCVAQAFTPGGEAGFSIPILSTLNSPFRGAAPATAPKGAGRGEITLSAALPGVNAWATQTNRGWPGQLVCPGREATRGCTPVRGVSRWGFAARVPTTSCAFGTPTTSCRGYPRESRVKLTRHSRERGNPGPNLPVIPTFCVAQAFTPGDEAGFSIPILSTLNSPFRGAAPATAPKGAPPSLCRPSGASGTCWPRPPGAHARRLLAVAPPGLGKKRLSPLRGWASKGRGGAGVLDCRSGRRHAWGAIKCSKRPFWARNRLFGVEKGPLTHDLWLKIQLRTF